MDQVEPHLKQWVAIDNQMRILGDRMKELRDKKNTITKQITSSIETENLNNYTFKTADGQVKIQMVKDTQQLTFKHLETCLSEIIKNEEQVKKIIEYVKNKREVNYVPEIKRIYNN
jgi:hypothetical protein